MVAFPCVTPKQGSSGPLNFNAFFNILCVCVHVPLRDTSHSGDAFEWQGGWNGAWQGCDFRERHMLSRWFLCDSPHEGQLGQTGRQWTMVRTVCLHLWSCLSGRMFSIFTVCAVVRLKGHLISQPAEPYDLGNRNAHGGGFNTPSSSGDWCCDYFMPRPRCLFAGCGFSGGSLRCVCVCT